ncbi:porin [Neptuniibacter sp. CAU 1671]|uniref:porin n=1 Tax=Neptuniibacter sp. CAU 1671 TaxID=3032593 RepID=UPI0023DC2959|nr:porin [Neptuniibacter sp. CAU 1671]MDF2181954.1 porin [Neptuniibacter sp. CAU 1671]
MNNKKVTSAKKGMVSSLKTLSAMVMLSTAATTASADILIGEAGGTQLSMFGILDVGILYQDKVSTDGDEKLGMETSGLRQTVIGFKGLRPLDNGWNAFFNLEAHFDLDTGMFHGTGDATTDADDSSGRLLFRRQANLGLSGDWGTVIMGRQYGPALLAHLGTEPRIFKEQFSNLYAWAYSQLFTTFNSSASEAGRNANNDVGIFFKNAVQYRNTVGGLDFGILYSFGGQEGSQKDGDVIALGAAYTTGALTLSGSYQNMKDQQTSEDVVESWAVGAGYKIGDVTLKANFMNTENNDSLGNEVLDLDALGLGVDYQWSAKNTATVAYYINEDKAPAEEAETKSLVISNEYTMGPSTVLYTALAYVDSDDNMSAVSQYATSIVATPAPVGEKTTLINVGINFAF